jgi:hypothetical protein
MRGESLEATSADWVCAVPKKSRVLNAAILNRSNIGTVHYLGMKR